MDLPKVRWQFINTTLNYYDFFLKKKRGQREHVRVVKFTGQQKNFKSVGIVTLNKKTLSNSYYGKGIQ